VTAKLNTAVKHLALGCTVSPGTFMNTGRPAVGWHTEFQAGGLLEDRGRGAGGPFSYRGTSGDLAGDLVSKNCVFLGHFVKFGLGFVGVVGVSIFSTPTEL